LEILEKIFHQKIVEAIGTKKVTRGNRLNRLTKLYWVTNPGADISDGRGLAIAYCRKEKPPNFGQWFDNYRYLFKKAMAVSFFLMSSLSFFLKKTFFKKFLGSSCRFRAPENHT